MNKNVFIKSYILFALINNKSQKKILINFFYIKTIRYIQYQIKIGFIYTNLMFHYKYIFNF